MPTRRPLRPTSPPARFKPELLSPAGSLDKLKVAVSYGADAVYLAGLKFGLRTAAENFTLDELDEGVRFAHDRRAKVFVVLNGFLHDNEVEELPRFIEAIQEIGVDAVIASDLGVISTVQKNSALPIHLSTQASCLNEASGKLWKKMGVSRLILGREVSIEDAGHIKRATGLEVELFVHGSMCMAYSGHCTISNFTQGRDSNRGGCSQSCRFHYNLNFGDTAVENATFMSSKDLMGLQSLPDFFEYEIDSLKIEGRMRSQLYAGEISKIYREAVDCYFDKHNLPTNKLQTWLREMELIPHREYTEANLCDPAGKSSVYTASGTEKFEHHAFLGLIRRINSGKGYALLEVHGRFERDDEIEVLPFKGPPLKFRGRIENVLGCPIELANPNMLVRIPHAPSMAVGQIVRRVVNPSRQ